MAEPIITKGCSRCKIMKPTSDFYRDRHNKDGFRSQCKDCGKAYQHSEAGLATQRRYYRRRTPLHYILKAMHQRCRNEHSSSYKNYGGRGIRVCERWNKLENFVADMGPTYKKGLEIERRDNNGDYCPENCYWVTRDEQSVNKRNNHLLTYCGKTQPLATWARKLRIRQNTILMRLRRGWPIERALSEPTHVSNQKFMP